MSSSGAPDLVFPLTASVATLKGSVGYPPIGPFVVLPTFHLYTAFPIFSNRKVAVPSGHARITRTSFITFIPLSYHHAHITPFPFPTRMPAKSYSHHKEFCPETPLSVRVPGQTLNKEPIEPVAFTPIPQTVPALKDPHGPSPAYPPLFLQPHAQGVLSARPLP